jgi:hypothetical protein
MATDIGILIRALTPALYERAEAAFAHRKLNKSDTEWVAKVVGLLEQKTAARVTAMAMGFRKN